MDFLIPASKIANLRSGEIVARIGRESNTKDRKLSTYYCKVVSGSHNGHLKDLPKYYDFGSKEEKETTLRNNMLRINREVAGVIDVFIR